MKHTISILVENKFGVLSRISGLFSGRGFNIESLNVGETHDKTISRVTIVVNGDDKILEQVNKQLNKLIDVIKVIDFAGVDYVERELVLLKVSVTPKTRMDVIQIVNVFRAKVVDISDSSIIIETTGGEEKIDAILGMLKPFGIKEMARTGKVAMSRK